jgi:hypothetical protein
MGEGTRGTSRIARGAVRFGLAAMACVAIASAGCSSSDGSADEASAEAALSGQEITVTGKPGYRLLDYKFTAVERGPLYRGNETFTPASGAPQTLPFLVTSGDVTITSIGVNQFMATITGTSRSYRMSAVMTALTTRWVWTVMSQDEQTIRLTVTGFGTASQHAALVGGIADDVLTIPTTGEGCIGDPPGGTVGFDHGTCGSADLAQCFEDQLQALGCSPPDAAKYQLHHQPGFRWNVDACSVASAQGLYDLVWRYQATPPVFSSVDCVGGAAGTIHTLYDPRCTGCSGAFVPQ